MHRNDERVQCGYSENENKIKSKSVDKQNEGQSEAKQKFDFRPIDGLVQILSEQQQAMRASQNKTRKCNNNKMTNPLVRLEL